MINNGDHGGRAARYTPRRRPSPWSAGVTRGVHANRMTRGHHDDTRGLIQEVDPTHQAPTLVVGRTGSNHDSEHSFFLFFFLLFFPPSSPSTPGRCRHGSHATIFRVEKNAPRTAERERDRDREMARWVDKTGVASQPNGTLSTSRRADLSSGFGNKELGCASIPFWRSATHTADGGDDEARETTRISEGTDVQEPRQGAALSSPFGRGASGTPPSVTSRAPDAPLAVPGNYGSVGAESSSRATAWCSRRAVLLAPKDKETRPTMGNATRRRNRKQHRSKCGGKLGRNDCRGDESMLRDAQESFLLGAVPAAQRYYQ